jgi:uncharacterized membrane protein HdeD (DUF308 family)
MDYSMALIIPIIIGVAEIIKKFGLVEKWIPVLDVGLGIAAGFIYLYPGDWKAAVLYGIIMGLSACGLFSGAKNVVEGFTK